MLTRPWPVRLWLIRHGQSVGNLADEAARAAGAEEIRLDERDPDVALSALGEQQAAAVGRIWPPGERPSRVMCSPFARARSTARLALGAAGLDVPVHLDERLRERDLGVFDGLTAAGITRRYPDETARRALLGKFYYRPPGGESWVDVALRVRSFVADRLRESPEPVAVFSHQAVLLVFRYVLESLDEAEVLRIDREAPFRNGALTEYAAGGDGLVLVRHDDDGHLTEEGTVATATRSVRADV